MFLTDFKMSIINMVREQLWFCLKMLQFTWLWCWVIHSLAVILLGWDERWHFPLYFWCFKLCTRTLENENALHFARVYLGSVWPTQLESNVYSTKPLYISWQAASTKTGMWMMRDIMGMFLLLAQQPARECVATRQSFEMPNLTLICLFKCYDCSAIVVIWLVIFFTPPLLFPAVVFQHSLNFTQY